MPTLRHTIIISGVSRRRLDVVASSLFTIVESSSLSTTGLVTLPAELRLLDPTDRTWTADDPSTDEPEPPAGARLVEGGHLEPGARYLLTGGESVREVTVRQWPSPAPERLGDMEISIATPRDTTPDDVIGHKKPRRWWRRERPAQPSPAEAPLELSGEVCLSGGATPRRCAASVTLRSGIAPRRPTQISADIRVDVDSWFEASTVRRPTVRRWRPESDITSGPPPCGSDWWRREVTHGRWK